MATLSVRAPAAVQLVRPFGWFGYGRVRESTDVLLQIKEDILDRISCTTTRAVLALDIKGAFDNVSHTLVFENLASTGCGPRMYDYVRDFLSNWMATIGIESIRTSTIPIPSKGNRQGSVLSPTLLPGDVQAASSTGTDSPDEAYTLCHSMWTT
ncbi:hypothetical protein ISCGN_029759 [Ixodes scapularis]